MKIEKLPSGSYRVRKMYKGQTYTVTFDGKPTQKEAIQAISEELDKIQGKHERLTFRSAADRYIESKRNVLSPSTIAGYKKILNRIPESFLNENIHDLTALDVQNEINRVAKDHSPKTVRNHHGFISAILSTFCPNLKFVLLSRKRSKMSRLSRLTAMLSAYWIMQKGHSLKSLSFLPAMGYAGLKYVH